MSKSDERSGEQTKGFADIEDDVLLRLPYLSTSSTEPLAVAIMEAGLLENEPAAEEDMVVIICCEIVVRR